MKSRMMMQLVKKRLISAGGLVFRIEEGRPIFLLLGFRKRNTWCLPKGLIEEGETEVEAAMREVMEETGLKNLSLIDKIGDIHYSFWSKGRNFDKTVHFYLFETSQRETTVGEEHDMYAWFSYERAMEALSYRNEREILKRGFEIAAKRIKET
ncbi:MAG: NUDIX hydrolase [Candidatus Bathyarchaeia archaeon]